jgi:hypothetical protein
VDLHSLQKKIQAGSITPEEVWSLWTYAASLADVREAAQYVVEADDKEWEPYGPRNPYISRLREALKKVP